MTTLPAVRMRKTGVKWTPAQDEMLRSAVSQFGGRQWKRIAELVPGRDDAQCLQRWTKTLMPGIVKGRWSADDDAALIRLVSQFGTTTTMTTTAAASSSSASSLPMPLPLSAPNNQTEDFGPTASPPQVSTADWARIAESIPGRTSKQCRQRWMFQLDPSLKRGPFSPAEDAVLLAQIEQVGRKWALVAQHLPGRTADAVKVRCKSLERESRRREREGREGGMMMEGLPLRGLKMPPLLHHRVVGGAGQGEEDEQKSLLQSTFQASSAAMPTWQAPGGPDADAGADAGADAELTNNMKEEVPSPTKIRRSSAGDLSAHRSAAASAAATSSAASAASITTNASAASAVLVGANANANANKLTPTAGDSGAGADAEPMPSLPPWLSDLLVEADDDSSSSSSSSSSSKGCALLGGGCEGEYEREQLAEYSEAEGMRLSDLMAIALDLNNHP